MIKRVRSRLVIIFCLFHLLSCQEGDSDFAEMEFIRLPKEVQAEFNKLYDYVNRNNTNYLPPFSECANINAKGDCKVEYKYHNPFLTVFIPQKFIISSNKRKAEIPFGTLERIFVIKNDSVYYPFTLNGGMTAMGEPRSRYIKIDTVMFRAKKMFKE
ncbi:hypothetical protein [Flavobacterium sp.]|uniref:hypothetical protein n=1 Tax=Flavobacterium sp. TaxID=239 RepID=UPI003D0FE2F2